jgi:hypothetical protein
MVVLNRFCNLYSVEVALLVEIPWGSYAAFETDFTHHGLEIEIIFKLRFASISQNDRIV